MVKPIAPQRDGEASYRLIFWAQQLKKKGGENPPPFLNAQFAETSAVFANFSNTGIDAKGTSNSFTTGMPSAYLSFFRALRH